MRRKKSEASVGGFEELDFGHEKEFASPFDHKVIDLILVGGRYANYLARFGIAYPRGAG